MLTSIKMTFLQDLILIGNFLTFDVNLLFQGIDLSY